MNNTSTTITCTDAVESIRFVLDGELGPEATGLLNKHLAQCPACGQEFERRKKVLALLGNTFQQKRISESFDVTANRKLIAMKETKEQPPVGFSAAARKNRPESKLMRAAAAPEDQDFNEEELEEEAAPKAGYFENLGAAPWWAVSLALHVLIIALASLVSMSIELPKSDDSVIMVTELSQRQELPTQEQEKKKESDLDALQSKHDTPPTDPNSKEASDIVVPPDILAKAELGDHFETINPDLPDTHSALGNPDSHSFHSVEGNTEPEGGGGMNGIGMEDMIGVGGAASKGTGGGFGGGDGTGTGVGTGAGHGSFGQRNGGGRKLMVKRHGGSKATENAVDKALEWLAYHQEADGHWDSKKYDGGKADYWKVPQCDTAVTALSTLAFLGAGHSEKVGTYKDNVKRAVAWLKSKQQPDGRVFDTADNCGFDHNLSLGYSIAMATMALSEAAGMANVPETKMAASKAVQYCVETHAVGNGSETGAWRYEPKMEADISVTGWFVMALKSAKVAGIHVPPSAFEGAIKFIDQMEIKNAGPDTGYGPASRYEYQKGVGTNHRRCAIGNLCRQFMGWKKEDLQSSVELFVKDGGIPEWTDKGDKQHDNKLDMYYWYYGTLCVFQQGGDLWKSWNEGLKGALVPNQRKGGDENGSWDPLGTYSECWGRVGSTALGALCLEVYYRYLQLSPDKH